VGELDEDSARAETVRRTRRFARRQDTWFRKDSRIRWLPHDAPDLLRRAVALLEDVELPAHRGVQG
jgi:tRNA dimethylallyltransferase